MNRLLLPLLTVATLFIAGCARQESKLIHNQTPFSGYESATLAIQSYSLDDTNLDSKTRTMTDKINCFALRITNKTKESYYIEANSFRPHLLSEQEIATLLPQTKFFNSWGWAIAGEYGFIATVGLIAQKLPEFMAYSLVMFPSILLESALIAWAYTTGSNYYKTQAIDNLNDQLFDNVHPQHIKPNGTTTIFMGTLDHDFSQMVFDIRSVSGQIERCTLQ